jgi:hypothetical protein
MSVTTMKIHTKVRERLASVAAQGYPGATLWRAR